ncbi:hypothetical protein AURDEDRAFT_175859 [Auricularia subglabra TFB-10046 SS5]|nr:hypothetical protein AURDEDRAFT_175859 [Auricularia subglabra TFB-10046 SS5]
MFYVPLRPLDFPKTTPTSLLPSETQPLYNPLYFYPPHILFTCPCPAYAV